MASVVEQSEKAFCAFWDWVAEQHAGLSLEIRKAERHALEMVPVVEGAAKRGIESDLREEFNTNALNYFALRSKFAFFDKCFLDAFGREQSLLPNTATVRLLWEWYRAEQCEGE